MFSEQVAVLQAVAPNVDVFNTGFSTAAFRISNYEKLIGLFNFNKILTTGVGNLKWFACDNAAKANPVAIKFHYVIKLAEVEGAITEAVAADGVSNAANTSGVIIMEVRQRQCPDGKPFVYCAATETVDDPVTGSMLVLGVNPQIAIPGKPLLLT